MKSRIRHPLNPHRVEILTHRECRNAVAWTVTNGHDILAGGYCRTHEDARSDARIWCDLNGKTVIRVARQPITA